VRELGVAAVVDSAATLIIARLSPALRERRVIHA
jgi:hypothetical protein